MLLFWICFSKVKGMEYFQIDKKGIHTSMNTFVEIEDDIFFFPSVFMDSDVILARGVETFKD